MQRCVFIKSEFQKISRSKANFAPTWRRWRDSNSRTVLPAYRISSADPSTTWVHLRIQGIFRYLSIIPYSRIGFKSFSARNRIFLFPPPQQTTASLHPSKEKAADICRPLFKIQNQTRSYSTTPSIMVMSTLTLCSSRVSISRTLQSRTIMSASLPTSRLPLMFSS